MRGQFISNFVSTFVSTTDTSARSIITSGYWHPEMPTDESISLPPKRFLPIRAVSMIFLAGFTFGGAAQVEGAQSREQSPDRPIERVMTARTGERVLVAQECFDEDDFACTIETLTPLVEQLETPFERYIVLRLRGYAHHGEAQTDLAIDDFLAALNTGVAADDEEVALRLNIGQLYIITERYSEGIAQMELAVRAGADLTPNLALMLAQAFAQASRHEDGLVYAEMQFDTASPRERRHYEMLLHYYQQLGRIPDQLRLVTHMVEQWPEDRNNWTSLVALMAQTQNESGAFEANKLMYLNGMLREERELVRLAQYYSYFEYPYRGAIVLEREMNAGRVSRSRANLEILANMWRQAREFQRAIPILEAAADLGGGEAHLRLAEAYYQDSRLEDAERVFERALEIGDLTRPGDAWALLGTVRYELGYRERARTAFSRCEQFSYSRRTCLGWSQFINRETDMEIANGDIVIRVNTQECRNTVNEAIQLETLTGSAASVDENGEIFITVPERCREYFNAYGEQIGGYGFEQPSTESDT